jgi:hypothetical protein
VTGIDLPLLCLGNRGGLVSAAEHCPRAAECERTRIDTGSGAHVIGWACETEAFEMFMPQPLRDASQSERTDQLQWEP